MRSKVRICELCNEEATLYCGSDAAFLCFDCDSDVHNANFLVSRHLRRLICRRCTFTTANAFSGTRSPSLRRRTCCFCSTSVDDSGEELDAISCSSSSSSTLSLALMSSTESQPPAPKTGSCGSASEVTAGNKCIQARISGQVKKYLKKSSGAPPSPETKTEDIFENWCKKLGLNRNLVLPGATHAAGVCSGRKLPLRVSLAASLWFGVRLCGVKSMSTWQNLRRLEEISGVPAKLIAAVELRLEQALRAGRLQRGMKEGWAESS